ncbi:MULTISPECIES: hypothetical protein [unclassified Mesorhizobium]|uniref:hypothetical protein n=1 Tax=unclassified Mesorhizobium TaxID=325217 RepID=UPI0033354BD5
MAKAAPFAPENGSARQADGWQRVRPPLRDQAAARSVAGAAQTDGIRTGLRAGNAQCDPCEKRPRGRRHSHRELEVPADVLDVRMDAGRMAAGMSISRINVSGEQLARHSGEEAIKGIVRIDGWEDRNSRPPFVDVTVYITFHDGAPAIVPVEFEVALVVYAEKPYRTTLGASMNVRVEGTFQIDETSMVFQP